MPLSPTLHRLPPRPRNRAARLFGLAWTAIAAAGLAALVLL